MCTPSVSAYTDLTTHSTSLSPFPLPPSTDFNQSQVSIGFAEREREWERQGQRKVLQVVGAGATVQFILCGHYTSQCGDTLSSSSLVSLCSLHSVGTHTSIISVKADLAILKITSFFSFKSSSKLHHTGLLLVTTFKLCSSLPPSSFKKNCFLGLSDQKQLYSDVIYASSVSSKDVLYQKKEGHNCFPFSVTGIIISKTFTTHLFFVWPFTTVKTRQVDKWIPSIKELKVFTRDTVAVF